MPPCLVSRGRVARRANHREVDLVIHSTAALQQFPVQRSCSHIERSRVNEHLASCARRNHRELRKAYVVADTKPNTSKGCACQHPHCRIELEKTYGYRTSTSLYRQSRSRFPVAPSIKCCRRLRFDVTYRELYFAGYVNVEKVHFTMDGHKAACSFA